MNDDQTLLKELVSKSLSCQPYFHSSDILIVERDNQILFLKVRRRKLTKNTRNCYRIDFLVSSYKIKEDNVKHGFFRIYFDEEKNIVKTSLKIYE